MNQSRHSKLLCIYILAILIVGCAYAPSRRLVRDPFIPPVQVAGWKIIPDICAFQNVDGVDTSRWDFGVGLWTELPRPHSIDSNASFLMLNIDSLELTLQDSTRMWLSLEIATFPSNKSDEKFIHVHHFIFDGSRGVPLPPGTQKATARFAVRVQKAYHRYKDVEKGLWKDSFLIDSTMPEENVQVTIPLVLREKPGSTGPED